MSRGIVQQISANWLTEIVNELVDGLIGLPTVLERCEANLSAKSQSRRSDANDTLLPEFVTELLYPGAAANDAMISLF